MKTKKPKKPELPKPRNFFPRMGPRWLKVEPTRLAALGGLFFGTVAMVFYFIRQCLGDPMNPMEVVLGVGKVFLVSYACIGFYIWYLLHIAERELTPPKKPSKSEATVNDDVDEARWEEDTEPPIEEPED